MENNEDVATVDFEVKDVVVEGEPTMDQKELLMLEIEKLKLELENAKLKKEVGVDAVKKNHVDGKADPNRKYVLLAKPLANWGRVPQQQADLAAIMAESMEVGTEWTEEELFELIKDGAKEYASLRTSRQAPTVLFRYYRGLKNDGKHAGFVARKFVRVIG